MSNSIRLKNNYIAFDYASLSQNNTQTLDITAWSVTTLPLSSNATFETNNSNSFSHSGSGIKCNFKGVVLIYVHISTDTASELDMVVGGDWFTNITTKNSDAVKIKSVNVDDTIYLQFATGLSGNHPIHDGRLSVVRIA